MKGSPIITETEVWSSRSLDMMFLHREDNWNNPCLLDSAASKSGRQVWFWRVDPTFAKWVVRAISKADTNCIVLPPEFTGAVTTIREVIEASGTAWATIEQAASGPPVKLPGLDMLAALTNHAKYGYCDPWEGWEKDLAKLDKADAVRSEADEVARMRHGMASVASSVPVAATGGAGAVIPPEASRKPVAATVGPRKRAKARRVESSGEGLFR